MKKTSTLILVVTFLFNVGTMFFPSEASAATLICSKCGATYSDREILQEGKVHEKCSVGGKKHYFYPAGGNGHPESTSSYKMVVKQMQGNWYNDKGTCLSINEHYFNGCRILSVADVAGGGSNFGVTITLDEAENTRDMRISVQIAPEAGNSTFSDGTLTPRIIIDKIAYYKK